MSKFQMTLCVLATAVLSLAAGYASRGERQGSRQQSGYQGSPPTACENCNETDNAHTAFSGQVKACYYERNGQYAGSQVYGDLPAAKRACSNWAVNHGGYCRYVQPTAPCPK